MALLCGMRPCSACPDVVEVLMAAGATDLVQAAAAGDTPGPLRADTRARPSRGVEIAAEYGQLDVIDQLLAASTPVDGVDKDGSPFCTKRRSPAAQTASDTSSPAGPTPAAGDTRFGSTPLGWCRH